MTAYDSNGMVSIFVTVVVKSSYQVFVWGKIVLGKSV